MTSLPWRLPWTSDDVPHAVLDVGRGCNISCRTCFNSLPPTTRTLDEIERDLNLLVRLRNPHSVAIVGGEATLHPQLCDIVRMVRARGIHVELFSNGVLLTEESLGALAAAGTDMIFLHVEVGQRRPDLAPDATLGEVLALVETKSKLIVSAEMESGLVATLFENRLKEAADIVRCALESPNLAYVLFTLFRDSALLSRIRGNLGSAMWGERTGLLSDRKDNLDTRIVGDFLKAQFELEPFAYLGSNLDDQDPRWISYLVGTVHAPGRKTFYSSLLPSAAEKLFLAAHRKLGRRYPFYQRENPGRFRVQLILNALTGGAIAGNVSLLYRSICSGSRLGYTRIVVQTFADVLPDGRVVHCAHCPDAMIHNGALVPVCLVDRLEGERASPPQELRARHPENQCVSS